MTTREELYRLVWSEPMITAAAQFDVSGSYLARVCEALSVPRPARGYWQKLAVGKAPAPEPLPEAQPGDQVVWRKDAPLSQPIRRPRISPPQRERRANAKVSIPEGRVHYLIRGAKAHFLNTRPVEEGAYLKPFKKLLVDVEASSGGIDRALDLANDLFNALESVGYRVMIPPGDHRWSGAVIDEREVITKDRHPYYRSSRWSPQRPTVVFIGEVAIGLTILEMSEEVLLRYVDGKYIRESEYLARHQRHRSEHTWTTTNELPNGRLRIGAFSPYGSVTWSVSWQETKTSTLSGSIAMIVHELEKATPRLAANLKEAERQAEIRHQEWIAADERRKRADDRRRVEESIRESRDELSEVIERWAAVMSIEDFFAGVSARIAILPEDQKGIVADRLRLARDFLGSRDPLEFFSRWKTPSERYRPIYAQGDDGSTDTSDEVV